MQTKPAIVLIATLIAIAPAISAQTITGPSGETLTVVKCNGDAGKCLNDASRVCNGSYQVRASESHEGGLLADLIPAGVPWYSLAFTCGPSDGTYPEFPNSPNHNLHFVGQ
jgi:hypothetical protein